MSDDGYIHLRVVQQLMAGNGLVFNAGERVEASSSPLWVLLIAALKWTILRPMDLPWIAVVLGLATSLGGLAIAQIAARRVARTTPTSLFVPFGALIVACIAAFWDYATSGLETGLVLLWLAASYWALAAVLDRASAGGVSRRRVLATGLLLGVSWMVRPDLAVFTVSYLAAALYLDRSHGGWRRRALWVIATLVVPVGFEIFRAGYYGVLVPNTALAKDAGSAEWGQGMRYLGDFIAPYWLWLPLIAVAVLLGSTVVRYLKRGDSARPVLMLAPVIAGLLNALFVIRVGGDFMHARLLLPAVFAIALPVATVTIEPSWIRSRTQLGKRWVPVASCTVVAAWALIAAFGLRYSVVHRVRLGDRVLVRPSNPDGTIDDERRGAQMATGRTNPVTVADFPTIGEQARAAARAGRRGITMLIYGGFERSYALRGDFAIPQVWAISGIGIFSYAAGTDVFVDDPLGLASPIGSRLPSEQAARRPGHRKSMSPAWTLARFGGRLRSTAPVSAADVQAARQALECGRLKRLLDGIDQPLTIKRFLENISQAGSNTTFRISRGVRQARRNLCG